MVSLRQPNIGKGFSSLRALKRKIKKYFRHIFGYLSHPKTSLSHPDIYARYMSLRTILASYISTKIIRIGTYYAIFLVLITGIVQPQLLQFNSGADTSIISSIVFAQQLAKDQQDGSLQFENLLADSGDDNRLIYTVKSGDSIGTIARKFATSTKELLKANDFVDGNLLRPGQKIIISYAKDQLIYEVKEGSTLEQFALNNELDVDELMNLNFLPSVTHVLQEGDQLLLDLSIPEAQRKNLYQKPEYETPNELLALDMPEEDLSIGIDEVEGNDVYVGEVDQKIISAEETTNGFDTEEERKIQEIKNREIAVAQAKIDAQRKEAEKRAELAALNSSVSPAIPVAAPVEQVQQRVIEAQATSSQCGSNKCFYKGKCWNLPAHASCAGVSAGEAWTCNSGYKEYGSQCLTNAVYEKKKAIEDARAVTKPAKHGIVSKRYFNPSSDGYNNGWARGHCTHGAGRRRWKNYGIMTNWRGNGGKRYWNASAAGRQVGQTPEVGAIFSTKGSAANGRYGHVGVVTQIDRASGSMMVVDMNYAGQYTFSQRRVPIKMPGLIGFIYPRKK